MARRPEGPLKRGWTTGACATAATRAAYTALLTGAFPDPVTIRLPRGETLRAGPGIETITKLGFPLQGG